ncbi:LOW QUALITY PROTEIN: uncharacterized protein LOC143183441, partial [Calliopsis andreniformis]|uniref:LOW QUALITY PROTEIN: uncharacterized protein LOC143183441 n=1 Tax=Calliopsis andreniformis TaxID=337506 RepID=UPI003FCD4CA6
TNRQKFAEAALTGYGGQVEGRKSGRNARRVVTAGRRPVDGTFPLSNRGSHLEASLPLGRGQCCGRGPLVTRYMPTKDMDAARVTLLSRLAFVTRTIDDMSHDGIRRRRTNYDSPWARICAGIDDEPRSFGVRVEMLYVRGWFL